MYEAAVYVFTDAMCMEFGFTSTFRYFKTLAEAESYAQQFTFARLVKF